MRAAGAALALLVGAVGPLRAQVDPELDAAEAALDAGRLPEAREALTRWLSAGDSASVRAEAQEAVARARWLRARLATDPDSAERDYAWAALEGGTRYGPRARLALAQLRLARGDAARALEDLERLRADFPGSDRVPVSWLWTGHALEAAGDADGACEAWVRAAAGAESREEAEASLAACGGAGGGRAARPAAADGAGVAVQLGAFRDPEPARALRRRAAERGVESRVEEPPEAGGWYRVRAGPFADRAEALAVVERLRRLGFEAIVVEER